MDQLKTQVQKCQEILVVKANVIISRCLTGLLVEIENIVLKRYVYFSGKVIYRICFVKSN